MAAAHAAMPSALLLDIDSPYGGCKYGSTPLDSPMKRRHRETSEPRGPKLTLLKPLLHRNIGKYCGHVKEYFCAKEPVFGGECGDIRADESLTEGGLPNARHAENVHSLLRSSPRL